MTPNQLFALSRTIGFLEGVGTEESKAVAQELFNAFLAQAPAEQPETTSEPVNDEQEAEDD